MEEVIHNFSKSLSLHYDEVERLRDLISKHGGVNWKDALGNSQLVSKLALIEEIRGKISSQDTVVIIGGWIGLIPYLMNLKNLSCAEVVNVEIDQVALAASDSLNADCKFTYTVLLEDALKVDYKIWKNLFVINTSCEHFSSFEKWTGLLPARTPCLLQSNNMFDLDEHVNCHKDLSEFKSKSGLLEIVSEKQIDIGDGWNRFMIFGKR